jgi:hypothetical protein
MAQSITHCNNLFYEGYRDFRPENRLADDCR